MAMHITNGNDVINIQLHSSSTRELTIESSHQEYGREEDFKGRWSAVGTCQEGEFAAI